MDLSDPRRRCDDPHVFQEGMLLLMREDRFDFGPSQQLDTLLRGFLWMDEIEQQHQHRF